MMRLAVIGALCVAALSAFAQRAPNPPELRGTETTVDAASAEQAATPDAPAPAAADPAPAQPKRKVRVILGSPYGSSAE